MKKILFFLILLIISTIRINVKADTLAENAKSAILIEASTGEIIFKKNETEKRAPASMTKMMSLLLIMEEIEKGNLKWDEKIKISETAASMGGSQIYLETNEIMSVFDLVKGISMASANDAVVALAERISGSEEEFVKLMNKRSKELGLKNTNFKNSTGLDEEGHYSSAEDMAKIARELVKHKKILEFSSTYEDYLRQNTNNKFWLVNTNKLVKTYEGMDGLKTGFTESAMYCLTATALRNDERLIGVLMGEDSSKVRNSEMVKLLDYGFNAFEVDKFLKNGEVVSRYKNDKSARVKNDVIVLDNVYILNKKGEKKRKITYDVMLDDIKLPVEKNEKIGELIARENGKEIFRIGVVSKNKIKKANIIELYFRNIGEFINGEYIF